MPENIELKPISPGVPTTATLPAQAALDYSDTEIWAWVTASVFTILALPLLVSPKIFLLLSTAGDATRTVPTPLESFLSVHLGMGLLSVALGLVVGTPASQPLHSPTTQLQHPLLVSTTFTTLLSSLISYNSTRSIGTLGTIVSASSGLIGIWGAYVIMFGSSKSISRTTGADKHTSSFIFGNKAAASAVKKRWREEQETARRAQSER